MSQVRACGFALTLCAVLALSACAPVRIKSNDTLLAAQATREQALAPKDKWTIEARLGVSDGEDGGSGSLTWVEAADGYEFTLRAPVTGRSFALRGDAGGAVLEGLEQGPIMGPAAGPLLARVFGWEVPMAQLRYWVRGMRAPDSSAELVFGANKLPAVLLQDGWKVEYRDWFEQHQPPLPRKVFAERGPYRVRVSIRRWVLP